MRTGSVEHVHVAPDSGEPMEYVESVEAVAGRGLRGDRYFGDAGILSVLEDDPGSGVRPASEVTFIETEAVAAAEAEAGTEIAAGTHRRNVTTRGVALNHLVGAEFEVGEVVFEGLSLCEPCEYMQSLIGEENLRDALVHRGGLNARIVESGVLSVGDEVRW